MADEYERIQIATPVALLWHSKDASTWSDGSRAKSKHQNLTTVPPTKPSTSCIPPRPDASEPTVIANRFDELKFKPSTHRDPPTRSTNCYTQWNNSIRRKGCICEPKHDEQHESSTNKNDCCNQLTQDDTSKQQVTLNIYILGHRHNFLK